MKVIIMLTGLNCCTFKTCLYRPDVYNKLCKAVTTTRRTISPTLAIISGFSKIVGFSKDCDQNGDRVSKNDESS